MFVRPLHSALSADGGPPPAPASGIAATFNTPIGGIAFAMELMRGRSGHPSAEQTIPAGVWYPAELQATARNNILEVARENALVWEI